MGGPDPPPPLVIQKPEIGLPPPPLLDRKNLKLANPPPPLVINHILTHSNEFGKPIFQEEISNVEINLTCVKYKEERRKNI